jgi:nucleoside-triphosphatase THEP1
MNTTSRIIILSQPERTGKTTALSEWVIGKNGGGILTPDDSNGKRVMHCTFLQKKFIMETENSREPYFQIGRFRFLQSAFDRGSDEIRAAIKASCEWIWIDEIGPLEIRYEQGFHAILSELIKDFDKHSFKLLLVVRHSMQEALITKYPLKNALVIDTHQLKRL